MDKAPVSVDQIDVKIQDEMDPDRSGEDRNGHSNEASSYEDLTANSYQSVLIRRATSKNGSSRSPSRAMLASGRDRLESEAQEILGQELRPGDGSAFLEEGDISQRSQSKQGARSRTLSFIQKLTSFLPSARVSEAGNRTSRGDGEQDQACAFEQVVLTPTGGEPSPGGKRDLQQYRQSLIANTIRELRHSEDFEFRKGNPSEAESVSSFNRHETVANLTFRGFAYYGPKTEVKRYKSFGQ